MTAMAATLGGPSIVVKSVSVIITLGGTTVVVRGVRVAVPSEATAGASDMFAVMLDGSTTHVPLDGIPVVLPDGVESVVQSGGPPEVAEPAGPVPQ
jgi:hypothetical protein